MPNFVISETLIQRAVEEIYFTYGDRVNYLRNERDVGCNLGIFRRIFGYCLRGLTAHAAL